MLPQTRKIRNGKNTKKEKDFGFIEKSHLIISRAIYLPYSVLENATGYQNNDTIEPLEKPK